MRPRRSAGAADDSNFYDAAVEWDDDEAPAPLEEGTVCERCGERVSPEEMRRCPFCHRFFCRSCAVRMGSIEYCSGACIRGMFWNDDVEDE